MVEIYVKTIKPLFIRTEYTKISAQLWSNISNKKMDRYIFATTHSMFTNRRWRCMGSHTHFGGSIPNIIEERESSSGF